MEKRENVKRTELPFARIRLGTTSFSPSPLHPSKNGHGTAAAMATTTVSRRNRS